MRLFHIVFAAASIAASFVSSAATVFIGAMDRFVDAILSISPDGARLVIDPFQALQLSTHGHAVDASLQQSMRHEAGVSRRAAPRKV